MNKIILKIGGMSCSACSTGLEKYLNKQKGISNATVNLVLSQALIEYDDSITIPNIETFIKEAGFESLGIYNNDLEENNKNSQKKNLLLFAILSIIILYISMSHMIGLPQIKILNMNHHPHIYSTCLFILTIPYLIYSIDIFKSGIKNLLHRTPNMDTLVSIGVFSSFLYSIFSMIMIYLGYPSYVHTLYFESSAIVIFFIKLGRYIDNTNKEKTKEALKELVQITPTKAILKLADTEKEVTIDEINKNDILICKPGMKIAVDGIITKGSTHLDEAFITGESLPVKKKINDKVIAGSINHDGYIEYKALKIGKDSTISEIVRLVIEATNTKSKTQRIADKISGYFVPTIIIIAILTFIGYLLLKFPINIALTSFVTVLVVACPCALGLATPLAIIISIGQCAKNGILIKTSEILETATQIDTIVFDKTGTLTYGLLKISKIYNYSNYNDKLLLSKVSSIEEKSTHPISNAFKLYTKEHNLKLENITNFTNLPGIGLQATINNKKISIGNDKLLSKLKINNSHITDEQFLTSQGNSIVYIIEDKNIIGLIGVKDIVRENAKKTINTLTKQGKKVIMLTGDNETTANIIANYIGIKKVISNVLPKDKTKIIKELIDNNHKVMMVGDGINDAPSLATANIGVSINSGTDIAIDSADIILINDNLEQIPTLLTISKKTLTIIKQNLFWAFFYNICMIPIAIGLLRPLNISMNPMIASLSMTISSLTVVLNSLRLKK